MEKEQKILELKKHIDVIIDEYSGEYETLAERSEKLYDEQELLRKEYETLDKKTGLNALFAELAKLKEEVSFE